MKTTQYANLLVTVEHASTGKMGGIGSYNNEVDKMADNLLVLLVDDTIEVSPAENIILCHQYISEHMPEMETWYKKNYDLCGYVILQVVQRLLQEYPSIKNIDTHEYSGVGARIAEGCRAGLLGRDVRVRTHGHGGQIQLERATGEWMGINMYPGNAMERSSMENADELWFSSRYLMELYKAAGVRVDADATHILGLPYDLREGSDKDQEFTEVKNLVFVGRMNRLKGYEVFTDVVDHLVEKAGLGGQIEAVIAIGKDDGTMPDKTAHLKDLASRHKFRYEQTLMTRDQVLEFEMAHAHDSLFILPYMSDNYSVAMLELIEAKAPIICLDTGGNRELIDTQRWQDRLALDTDGLSKIAQRLVEMPSAERQKDAEALYGDFYDLQARRNKQNADRFVTFQDAKASVSKQVVDVFVGSGHDAARLTIDPRTAEIYLDGNKVTVSEVREQLGDVYAFVAPEAVGIEDVDSAVRASQEALQRSRPGAALTVGVKSQEGAQLSLYGNLELFAFDPVGTILRNACVSIDNLLDYATQYAEAPAGRSRRNSEYFMAGLTYYLVSREIPIVPVPVLLEATTCKVKDIVFDEALFSDLAQFGGEPRWPHYRFVASMRHTLINTYEYRQYAGRPYLKTYVDTMLGLARKDNLLAMVVRTGVKLQLRLLQLAVAAKKLLS